MPSFEEMSMDRILVANARDAIDRLECFVDADEDSRELEAVPDSEAQYHTDAMRTAAGPEVFHPKPLNAAGAIGEFVRDLIWFEHYAQRLDRWKSLLFYGKDKPEPQEPFAPSNWQDFDFEHVANPQLIHAILGIGSESGEIVTDLLLALQGKLNSVDNLSRESGDVDWFQELLATAIGVPVAQSRVANIERLRLRFPDKFSEADAIARADEA